MRRALLLAAAVAAGTWAHSAGASLTPSEEAQIKGLVAGANVANAGRARALVARPDLAPAEVASILSEAVAAVPWTEARAAFFHELLFGGASLASRPQLAVGVVHALAARADALYAKTPADPDLRETTASELARLYAFLERDVASPGRSHGDGHDPTSGIPASAYDAASAVLAEHVQRNPRWLKPGTPLPPLAARLRSQLAVLLLEMASDTPTRRVDAADRIGLTGARRLFLTELGVLVLDDGKADDARVAQARALVQRLPAARADVEAVAFGEPSEGITARLPSRGTVLGVSAPLEATQVAAGYAVTSDEVAPGPFDLPLFLLAYELSLAALPRALDNRADLRAQVERDAKRGVLGRTAMRPDQTLADAMAQLLTDAPRAIDLAFGRWLRGQPESAALVSDALGALAAFAPPGNAAQGLVLPLARPDPDGDLKALPATRVRLFPSGAASSFTLSGHRMDLVRDASGVVVLVKADGARVSLAALPNARVPIALGNAWSGDGIVFARLVGAPRASVAPGPRIRLVAGGVDAVDAIATPSPGDDCAVDLDLVVRGEAGVVLRASAVRGGFQGASLVVDAPAGQAATAQLRVRSGTGAGAAVGPIVGLPAAPSFHVHMAVRGDAIEATIAGVPMAAQLPSALAHGDVALRVAQGASLEATSFRIR